MDKNVVRAIRYMNAFKWENQAIQYPTNGHDIELYRAIMKDNKWIDCILYYGDDNLLQGILNYYPFDFPPYEKKGNVNIQVKPDKRRKGIATALLKEAQIRFKINIKEQDYTSLGKLFIVGYMNGNNNEL